MFKRLFQASKYSYFIFGPRGTGKSTWLTGEYQDSLYINLLKSKDYRTLVKEPELLNNWLTASNKKIVVIDEIQKIPELLDEVQDIMTRNKNIKFVLTGSSARKLKKINANLLAGRARTREFYTITSAEMDFTFDVEQILKYGCLPESLSLKDEQDKIEYLEAYVQTYLNEEIKQEAIVRSIEPFIRFLEISSIMNGQIWNNSEIARDVGVARTTIEGYLSVILDTLIATRIESYIAKAKVKEKHNPKYYFFDSGVVRALANKLQHPLDAPDKGYLFETFLLNEIRAFASYNQKKIKIQYWGTPSLNEVDFVIDTGSKKIGIELKTSKEWKRSFNSGLNVLLQEKKINTAFGVYCGDRDLSAEGITVMSVRSFLKKLWHNKII